MREIFKWSVIVVLLITAMGKLIESGSALALRTTDPIFFIPFHWMLRLAALMEIAVVLVCVGVRSGFREASVAVLATNFLAYRLGLKWLGYQEPCACMGSLTEALPISRETGDLIIKSLLAYLLIGSYCALAWRWSRQRGASARKGETVRD